MAFIRQGMSGESVKNLQVALNRSMPLAQPLKVDGILGGGTLARVLEFQKAVGLKADGIVGPLTSKGLLASYITALATNAVPLTTIGANRR